MQVTDSHDQMEDEPSPPSLTSHHHIPYTYTTFTSDYYSDASISHKMTHTRDKYSRKQESSKKNLVKSIVMEISIATHSIIIGLDMGLMHEGQEETIVKLFWAFLFHQLFEGVSLGTSVYQSRLSK